ncbi:hypothetical protein [Dysgonomonas sp. 511]|uniref:hypothetical protein n=1 Tax=Dysgonomonas sp. 511 TaxID=2302930 RepID=UPI0013D5CBD5|nr:hypothetical protein [Dysgonomonas sp. 511]NDV78737.1 hypothetical protein [Dysgonomonas sp. 511]
MKTACFGQKIPLVGGLISTLFMMFSFSLLFISCDDDKEYGRGEFLIVSETKEKEATSGVYCKIEGGEDTLYVFSNVDYKLFFQTADKDEEWIKVLSSDYLSDIQATRIILEVSPRGDDLVKRTGVMSFSSEENFLGQFVSFNQGFNTRLKEDFTWLRYGTASPFDESKETLIENWTDVQKAYGWKSTTADGNTSAYCYGKSGYVKLGQTFSGADLISPYTNGVIKDTILMLSFDAVAYVSEMGVKDNNTLTVNILDGGEFVDGTTSKTIDIGYYDHTNRDVPGTMWNDARYHMLIVSRESNLFTGDTRVQFVTGNDITTGTLNRMFIDNVSLYIIDEKSYYLAEENIIP